MSRIWPHTPTAEEQAYSKPILWTHCFARAIQTGSLFGTGIGVISAVFKQRKYQASSSPTALLYSKTIIRSSMLGTVIGAGAMCIVLPIRMYGREDIEWKDRSWRLLESKGQVECDDWTAVGMVGGAISGVSVGAKGWRGGVGGLGMGSWVGMMGYMMWRYGVKGGKFEEEMGYNEERLLS